MKCKICGGTGYNDTQRGTVMTEFPPCPWCGGSGYVKDNEQTEQEWLQTCSTEKFAEWLLEHMHCTDCPANQKKCQRQYGACKEVIMEWLKQPHKE